MSADRFFSAVSHRVSKRPIWLADAAHPEAALPPTIQSIAGSWRSRSASLTSAYPARRPNTACLSIPTSACGEVGQPFARHGAGRACRRRDDRTVKLHRESALEIEPQGLAVRFTRRVRHDV